MKILTGSFISWIIYRGLTQFMPPFSFYNPRKQDRPVAWNRWICSKTICHQGLEMEHLNRDRDTDLLHPWLLNQTIEEFSFSVYRVPDSFKSMTTVRVYQMLFYCKDFICRFWRNITCSNYYNSLFIDDLDNTFDILKGTNLFGSWILIILSQCF